MMTPWNTAVKEVGEQLGIPNLTVGNNGHFVINLDTERCIAGEKAKSSYLIYAYEPAPYDGQKRLLWAWKNAYLKQPTNRPIKTALYEKNQQLFLIAAIHIRENECNPRQLQAAIKHVSQWLDDTCSI